MTKLLLDEQNFGLLTKPCYRYRKRFDQSSIIDSGEQNLGRYLVTPRLCYLEMLRYAEELPGGTPLWGQYAVMHDLTWRIKEQRNNFLTAVQIEEYRSLIRACLTQIDDRIICTVRNLWVEERICALALKYNITYEQLKEWIKPDKEAKALCFCRPGSKPLPFTRPWEIRVSFMDIVENRLLLRVSCPVVVPRERMDCVVEVKHPDGNSQQYPCELLRSPADRIQYLLLDDDIWARETFELALPLVNGASVRAYFSIDGIRFDVKWGHIKLSPFVRGIEATYLSRSGYILSNLPKNEGFCLEPWTPQRVQERERVFLDEVTQKSPSSSMRTARIRRISRRIRQLSKKPIWLISDRIIFAGDNGEALFEYLMANPGARQGIRPFFLLSRDSEDWERVKQIGPTVAYGSDLHQVLFLAADKIVSSSADDEAINPFGQNDWRYRDLFNFDYVFLQHGVILHDLSSWLKRTNKNIALFVTSVARERQSILEGDYEYTGKQILLSGLPRHDKLIRQADAIKPQRLVVVMPTWRKALVIGRESVSRLVLHNPDFERSEYYRFWNGLINQPRLLEALQNHDYRIRFVIHPNFTLEASTFVARDPAEILVSHCNYSQTFCEAALLLTDYSSVAFDFALLKKPIIYFQFDQKTVFAKHWAKGYFDYRCDGFGSVCEDIEMTVDTIIRYLQNGCEMESHYRKRVDDFFGQQPENRCQTVIDAIKKLGRRPE